MAVPAASRRVHGDLSTHWVGGESLVRDLVLGREQARALGVDASNAGLMCDVFGHASQVSQMLRGFGSLCPLIWRGVNTDNRTLLWRGAFNMCFMERVRNEEAVQPDFAGALHDDLLAVVDSVRHGTIGDPLASGREALVVQTVVDALYRSARSGREVPVEGMEHVHA
ncbi:MAG: alpha-mannosidase [Solirubrobacteraceae bacterium]